MSGQTLASKIQSELRKRLKNTKQPITRMKLLCCMGRTKEAVTIKEELEEKRRLQRERAKTLALATGQIKE